MSRGILIKLTALFMVTLMVSSFSDAQSTPRQLGVDLYISGPSEIFVNQTTMYRVELRGSFSGRATNWSLEVVEFPGALKVNPPSSRSNVSNTFYVNVTATRTGTYNIRLQGYCSDDEEVRYGESSLNIRAVVPATVEVDINNPSEFVLKNITIGVFVDGSLKGKDLIPSLEPGETQKRSIDWSREGLSPGEHKLEVWVDYGYTDSTTFIKDELLMSTSIYVKGEGAARTYALPIALAAVGGGVFFFLYMRKKRKRRRPW